MWLHIWDNQGLKLEGDRITEMNCVGPHLAHSQLVLILGDTQLGNHKVIISTILSSLFTSWVEKYAPQHRECILNAEQESSKSFAYCCFSQPHTDGHSCSWKNSLLITTFSQPQTSNPWVHLLSPTFLLALAINLLTQMYALGAVFPSQLQCWLRQIPLLSEVSPSDLKVSCLFCFLFSYYFS